MIAAYRPPYLAVVSGDRAFIYSDRALTWSGTWTGRELSPGPDAYHREPLERALRFGGDDVTDVNGWPVVINDDGEWAIVPDPDSDPLTDDEIAVAREDVADVMSSRGDVW